MNGEQQQTEQRVPLEEWVAQMERDLAERWNPRPPVEPVRHVRLWEQEEDESWEP